MKNILINGLLLGFLLVITDSLLVAYTSPIDISGNESEAEIYATYYGVFAYYRVLPPLFASILAAILVVKFYPLGVLKLGELIGSILIACVIQVISSFGLHPPALGVLGIANGFVERTAFNVLSMIIGYKSVMAYNKSLKERDALKRAP